MWCGGNWTICMKSWQEWFCRLAIDHHKESGQFGNSGNCTAQIFTIWHKFQGLQLCRLNKTSCHSILWENALKAHLIFILDMCHHNSLKRWHLPKLDPDDPGAHPNEAILSLLAGVRSQSSEFPLITLWLSALAQHDGHQPTDQLVTSLPTVLVLRAPSRGENLSFLGVIGCVEKSPTGWISALFSHL